MLERIPGRRIGPLHIVEDQHERARCRGETNIFDDFLVQRVLTTDTLRSHFRSVGERGNEARQLAPHTPRRVDALLDRREDLRPRSVGWFDVRLERAPHDERLVADIVSLPHPLLPR